MLDRYKLRSGDPCKLTNQDGIRCPAIAWAASEKIQDNIVQTSKIFQELHSLKLGDKVFVERQDNPLIELGTAVVCEVTEAGGLQGPIDQDERLYWSWLLEQPLSRAEVIFPGLIFDNIELKGQKRTFKIAQIDSPGSFSALYRFMSTSKVEIRDAETVEIQGQGPDRALVISRDNIGGLNAQLQQLDKLISVYGKHEQSVEYPSYYKLRQGGILLYGQSGTGKTLILENVAKAGWRKVQYIGAGCKISTIFAEACRQQPSVIIIDDLEEFACKASDDYQRGINTGSILSQECTQLKGSHVLVIAATTDLSKVDERLRKSGCFRFEIEVPIPDSKTRTEILKVLTNTPRDELNTTLAAVGDRTHGYVGRDLEKLVHLAVEKAEERVLRTKHAELQGICGPEDRALHAVSWKQKIEVTEADYNEALLSIRPTAMQEIFLETPEVNWSDIGGQHEIKRALKEAVEWSLKVRLPLLYALASSSGVLSNRKKYPAQLSQLGITPQKGALLYGPPGCSKTLIAKAMATASGLNFLAVKGAELLNMYVGESERRLREIFRKARAASPSIIFFDEIDALGSTRESSHPALNVLTTLLNEMDGIEELRGVFVLAATNKPEVLDAALTRPGRLDRIFYVGPPDRVARREILDIRTRAVDINRADVDFEELADRMDGYSGAEIVTICQMAGMEVFREMVAQRVPLERRMIGRVHFEKALEMVPRGITRNMIEDYRRWARSRGA
jgi:AAA family ATPase